jgi:hypothetical protein
MALMKIKNSAGTWTEVDNFTGTIFNNNSGGKFTTVLVESTDRKTLDLSEYVKEGDNFILFYSTSTKHEAMSGYLKCMYMPSFGDIVCTLDSTTQTQGSGSYGGFKVLVTAADIGIVDKVDSGATCSFKDGIFTVSSGIATTAILLY